MPSFFQNLFKKEAGESVLEPPDAVPDRQTEPTSLLSAMNLSSPFAAAAGEQFTVRELAMLLPPQLVRTESLAADQPVALPLDMLRGSLQQGRPALRLSQIYLACPFLFNRQVQPMEDEEIALPFQKVKRMLDAGAGLMASPFAAVAPPAAARGADSPFATPGSPFIQAGAAPASPFAVRPSEPQALQEVLSPFPPEVMSPVEAPPAHNPFQRMEPAPPRPASSPFQIVAPTQETNTEPRPSVPVMPMTTASPFAYAGNGNGRPSTAPVPGAPPPPDNPFDSNPPSGCVPSPAPAAARESAAPPFVRVPEPLPPAPEAPAAHGGPVVRVLLCSLLRDATAEDLGFDPLKVPDHLEAELSLDTITPQLATGRVEVSIEELRQGVMERIRPALAGVRPGMRFVVPLSEIFKNLPASAIPAPQPAPHIPIGTSPFQTPFALKAEEDARGSQPALPQLVAHAPASLPHQMTPFPVLPSMSAASRPQTAPVVLPPAAVPAALDPAPSVPFLPPVSLPAQPSAPAGVAPIKLPGLPALPKLQGAAPGLANRPSPFARPPGMAPAVPAAPAAVELPPLVIPGLAPAALPASLPSVETHDDLGQTFSAASLRSEPPAPAPAPALEPFDPARLFAGAAPPKPAAPPPAPVAPVPVPPAAAPAGPPLEFNFGEVPDMARVTLRAIYDTDQDLTTHEIVDRIAQLPGLRSAIAIIGGGVIASGHDSGSEEVAQFINSAAKSCEYLAGLAESMGYGSSGSFTLRAGHGVRTFFIENGHCLAVLHAKSSFAPGVRDKLLLTARTLGDIAD